MFYEVESNNILNLLRFPRYLELVNRLYGKTAKSILKWYLIDRCLDFNELNNRMGESGDIH